MAHRVMQPEWLREGTLEDQTTEGAWNYPTVWYDEEQKIWFGLYGGTVPHSYSGDTGFFIKSQVLMLAESDDGIHWRKARSAKKQEGQTGTNVVYTGAPAAAQTSRIETPENTPGKYRIDGGPVYIDRRETDPGRRFKYLHRYFDEQGNARERMAVSPDGIHWNTEELPWGNEVLLHCPCPVFYNSGREEYTIVNWFQVHDRRIVFRRTKDWRHVSEPELVLQADTEDKALAETYAMPVFPYEDMYIGFLWMFRPDPFEINKNRLYGSMECYLTYSYHGNHFQRASHEPFLPRNSRGEHAGGGIFPSSMVVTQQDIRIYSGGCKGEMFRNQDLVDAALLTHRLRKDGFVCLEAQGRGKVLTKALRLEKQPWFAVNVKAPYGTLRARLLDASGEPVRGFSYEDFQGFTGDETDYRLSWNKRELLELAGEIVFLELEIRNGELYAVEGAFQVVGANDFIYQ